MAEKGRCPCSYESDVRRVATHQEACEVAKAAYKDGTLRHPAEEFKAHREYLASEEYEEAKAERTQEKHVEFRWMAEEKIARTKVRYGSRLTENEKMALSATGWRPGEVGAPLPKTLGNVEHEVIAALDPNPPNGPNAHVADTDGKAMENVQSAPHKVYGAPGEKTIDGIPAAEILENREQYTKMQVLRAEVAMRGAGRGPGEGKEDGVVQSEDEGPGDG